MEKKSVTYIFGDEGGDFKTKPYFTIGGQTKSPAGCLIPTGVGNRLAVGQSFQHQAGRLRVV